MEMWTKVIVLLVFFVGLNSRLFACNLCAAETHQHGTEQHEKAITHEHGEGNPAEKKTAEKEEKVFKKTVYVCPMGCETKDESGRCSKCGMNLEKKESYRTYACPEEKCDYHQAKPGECPEHKKKLVESEIKFHCPECGKEVKPEELKKKINKPKSVK
ncbi:MAG TPA: hypothetical protein DHV62_06850 [Elusimicrobia bacterium]|jgi:predicted RNA-binding Zn-ribbon protein involved in translation (DUF1610 family)|nr:hypothetical protein [Elusimicrobiota bacterium]